MNDCLICFKNGSNKMDCCEAYFHIECLKKWFKNNDKKCPHCQAKLKLIKKSSLDWQNMVFDIILLILVIKFNSIILTFILYMKNTNINNENIQEKAEFRIQTYFDSNRIILSKNELIIINKIKKILLNLFLTIIGSYLENLGFILKFIHSIKLINCGIENKNWIKNKIIFKS